MANYFSLDRYTSRMGMPMIHHTGVFTLAAWSSFIVPLSCITMSNSNN
jgi:hypothetical protein